MFALVVEVFVIIVFENDYFDSQTKYVSIDSNNCRQNHFRVKRKKEESIFVLRKSKMRSYEYLFDDFAYVQYPDVIVQLFYLVNYELIL